MRGLIVLFWLVDLATFIYLCVQDWQQVDGFFNLAICFSVNAFLATIWPIYWGVLHWIQ